MDIPERKRDVPLADPPTCAEPEARDSSPLDRFVALASTRESRDDASSVESIRRRSDGTRAAPAPARDGALRRQRERAALGRERGTLPHRGRRLGRRARRPERAHLQGVLGLKRGDGASLPQDAGRITVDESARSTTRGVAGGPRATGVLGAARKVAVGVVGVAVLVVGVALIVLPGPAFLVIPAGLAILATEFLWARRLLRYAKDRAARLLGRRRDAELARRS